jgi:hypothetical protein
MFPHIERRSRRIDDYGEGLDVGQWLRKGREIAEEGETEEVREAKRRKLEEDEKKVSPATMWADGRKRRPSRRASLSWSVQTCR